MKTTYIQTLLNKANINFEQIMEYMPTGNPNRIEITEEIITDIIANYTNRDLDITKAQLNELCIRLEKGEQLTGTDELILTYIGKKGTQFYITALNNRKTDYFKKDLIQENGYKLGRRIDCGDLTIDDRITLIKDTLNEELFGEIFQLYAIEINPTKIGRRRADNWGRVDQADADKNTVEVMEEVTLRNVNNHNQKIVVTRNTINTEFQYVDKI